MAEWLRRSFQVRVRKSRGSSPLECTATFFAFRKQVVFQIEVVTPEYEKKSKVINKKRVLSNIEFLLVHKIHVMWSRLKMKLVPEPCQTSI